MYFLTIHMKIKSGEIIKLYEQIGLGKLRYYNIQVAEQRALEIWDKHEEKGFVKIEVFENGKTDPVTILQ